MKKIIALLLILTVSLGCVLLAGCEKVEEIPTKYVDPVADREIPDIDDRYRPWHDRYLAFSHYAFGLIPQV